MKVLNCIQFRSYAHNIFLRVLFGMNSECLVCRRKITITINFHACMWWWYRHVLLLICTLHCTISQGRMGVTCRGVHWVFIEGQKSMVKCYEDARHVLILGAIPLWYELVFSKFWSFHWHLESRREVGIERWCCHPRALYHPYNFRSITVPAWNISILTPAFQPPRNRNGGRFNCSKIFGVAQLHRRQYPSSLEVRKYSSQCNGMRRA